ncbi:hypothetical protein ACFV4E_02640 [Streptomyces hygroscopicus]|uniref:hypothetical protein n=1 Tax=Streptomyces hygroscopicus TaxID=1912 RepID=UPI0036B7EFC1
MNAASWPERLVELRFVSFVLFVDYEAAAPGDGVSVGAPEGAVVEDAHASGGSAHNVEDAVDGDGGFPTWVLMGHVAGVKEDSGEIVFVFPCGEEYVFGAVCFVSTSLSLWGGCGVDAVVADFSGSHVNAAVGPGEGRGFEDSSVGG